MFGIVTNISRRIPICFNTAPKLGMILIETPVCGIFSVIGVYKFGRLCSLGIGAEAG
jgi:hypothetical protein